MCIYISCSAPPGQCTLASAWIGLPARTLAASAPAFRFGSAPFRTALQIRLGLPVTTVAGRARCRCGHLTDPYGHHALSCNKDAHNPSDHPDKPKQARSSWTFADGTVITLDDSTDDDESGDDRSWMDLQTDKYGGITGKKSDPVAADDSEDEEFLKKYEGPDSRVARKLAESHANKEDPAFEFAVLASLADQEEKTQAAVEEAESQLEDAKMDMEMANANNTDDNWSSSPSPPSTTDDTELARALREWNEASAAYRVSLNGNTPAHQPQQSSGSSKTSCLRAASSTNLTPVKPPKITKEQLEQDPILSALAETKAKMPPGLTTAQQKAWKTQQFVKRQKPLQQFAQTIGDDDTRAQWDRLKNEAQQQYAEETAKLTEKSVSKALSSSSRNRTSKQHQNPQQQLEILNADFRGSLYYDSDVDNAMVAVECILGDAKENPNGSKITDPTTGQPKTVNGSTKWWKVAEQISGGEFRMLKGLTDHRYVLPRIQEYIAATNRGDPKKAQKKWGRQKKHKGKPHRYLK